VIKVPASAINIPIASLLVTRSLRKNTPAMAIVIGPMVEIMFESIEVVLSVPRKSKPSETVERRKPLNKVRANVLGFLGSLKPVIAKIIIAKTAEIKKRYVRKVAGENPPSVNFITGLAAPQIMATIKSSI
jgi:hypothetical protein